MSADTRRLASAVLALAALGTPGCGATADILLAEEQVGEVTVRVVSRTPLKQGENRMKLTFRDARGEAVAVSSPALVALRKGAGTYVPAEQLGRMWHTGPGRYRVKLDLDRPGPWQFTISWYQAGVPKQWTFLTTAQ